MVAVGQEGRELRVVRAAPQRHHHGLRDLRRERFAAGFGDPVQHQVDAGRHAGAAVERRVEHEHAVGDHLAARLDLRAIRPDGGGAWWRAGPPAAPAWAASRAPAQTVTSSSRPRSKRWPRSQCSKRLRLRRCRSRSCRRAARPARPRRVASQCVGQRRKAGERRRRRSRSTAGSGRDEFDLEALAARRRRATAGWRCASASAGPAQSSTRLSGSSAKTTRIEGVLHPCAVALAGHGQCACAGPAPRSTLQTLAKRPSSTVAVRALMSAADSGRPSGWAMSKVSVASST